MDGLYVGGVVVKIPIHTIRFLTKKYKSNITSKEKAEIRSKLYSQCISKEDIRDFFGYNHKWIDSEIDSILEVLKQHYGIKFEKISDKYLLLPLERKNEINK